MGKRIIVVGAGLAGLVCARALQHKGFEPCILEASDGPGGRIRTDVVDGFRIDRGFQVYFEAYPHAVKQFDLRSLEMCAYRRGARMFTGLGFEELDLGKPLHSLISPAIGLADKLRLGALAVTSQLSAAGRDISTEAFLCGYGFSETCVQRFFRPFFGGIFLDASLSASSAQFEFLFRTLLRGRVSTPALGIGELTRQISDSLPKDAIRFNSPVGKVSGGGVVLSSGEAVEADAIVVACDPASSADLLGERFETGSVSSLTLYFATEVAPVDEPIIIINASGNGIVNLVAPLSVVSPKLAPHGKHLVAVTMFATPGESTVEQVKHECEDWFPDRRVTEWQHLKTVHVPFAQYRQDPGFRSRRPSILTDIPNVFRSGEILTNSSIDGACQAGEMTAQRVFESFVQ